MARWLCAVLAVTAGACSFSGSSAPGDGDGDGDGDIDAAIVDGLPGDVTCPAQSDLIACYPFDLDLADEAGDHDATVESGQTAFVAGADGTALGIQSQSVITIASSEAFTTTSFTIEFWLAPEFGTGFIFDHDNRFAVRIYNPDIVRCLIESDTKYSAEASVDDTRWNHIACVFDETRGLEIYVDQASTASNPATEPLATPTGTAAHVGSDSPGGGSAFLGAVDNLRIWGRALAPGELCGECDAIGDPNL